MDKIKATLIFFGIKFTEQGETILVDGAEVNNLNLLSFLASRTGLNETRLQNKITAIFRG
jgi:hypothetical protein